ncbi:uncharacterized protein F4812DRAFT_454517 [Daldinia caldariorum]|uniref:uncharacterized protein n=1 Tax=Daldinia caldariorum TaxID=326644 RepID=UPI00200859CB|nr:uncharacterized protein F4812DRAFT_454517 [Daldinia caldariorum]KAI1472704.1 hypothetical protein F4812DRAFT_454517 [Daldinia caldariorum]
MSPAVPTKRAGQEYGVIRSFLGNGRYKVQVIPTDGSTKPYIVVGVLLNLVRTTVGDFVLVFFREPKSKEAIITRVFSRAEAEVLINRAELPRHFDLISDDN